MVLSWAKQRADASAPWALGSASPPSHSANGVNLCSHLTSIRVNKTKSVFVTHYCNCLVSSLKIHLSNIEVTPPLFHSATVSILWILLELWRSFWDTSDLWDNQRESCEHFQSEIFFRNHYCDRKICFAFRDACLYHYRWIFGKVPNGLWPPLPPFFGKNVAIFFYEIFWNGNDPPKLASLMLKILQRNFLDR